jgi:hypothetical protein
MATEAKNSYLSNPNTANYNRLGAALRQTVLRRNIQQPSMIPFYRTSTFGRMQAYGPALARWGGVAAVALVFFTEWKWWTIFQSTE